MFSVDLILKFWENREIKNSSFWFPGFITSYAEKNGRASTGRFEKMDDKGTYSLLSVLG